MKQKGEDKKDECSASEISGRLSGGSEDTFRLEHNEEDYFGNLFNVGKYRVYMTAYNRTEQISRDQIGGACIAASDNFSSKLQEKGEYPMRLGRWCWLRVGGKEKSTVICATYQPCDPGSNTAGFTVWDQHRRYF